MRDRTIKQGDKEQIATFTFSVAEKKAQVQIVHGDLIDGEFVAYPVQNPEGYEIIGDMFKELCDDGFSEAKVWKIIDSIRSAALLSYVIED